MVCKDGDKKNTTSDLAFLHLPTNAERLASNQYEASMRAVARILYCRRPEGIDQHPEAPVLAPAAGGLWGPDGPGATGKSRFNGGHNSERFTYGGLHFSARSWLAIAADFKKGITAQLFDFGSGANQIALHMPGLLTYGNILHKSPLATYEHLGRIVALHTSGTTSSALNLSRCGFRETTSSARPSQAS